MKIKYFFVTGLFFLGFLSPILAQAEGSSMSMCPDDYYGFILEARSQSTRDQTLKDFFSLGYCQLNDVMELEAELEDLKDSFRSAAFNCADTSTYKTDYHEILMEIYFVRNIQKSTALNGKTAEALQKIKEEKLAKLKADMIATFVVKEARVSEPILDEYFENWSEKYDDRILKYAGCDEGAWAELTEPFTDFVDTLKGFKWDVETDGSGKFWEEVVNTVNPDVTVDADEDMTAIGESIVKAWNYLTTEKEIAKTEVSDPATPKSLSDSGETFSFRSALDALSESSLSYDLEEAGVDRMQRYKMLYGYGSANDSTKVQSIVEAMNLLLEESNNKDFPNIEALLAKIYDKQCN